MNKKNFSRYAWFVLFYNVFVILWGAIVRATGSGNGCGNHWPSCQGDVVPAFESTKVFVEYFHRITTAVDGLFVLFLIFWAFRLWGKGRVRTATILAIVFFIIESLLGMMLVRLELVEDNDTVLRAVAVAIHLINTFILLSCFTLIAWWSTPVSGTRPVNWKNGWLVWMIFLAVIICLVGASGAITALGDTLFPSVSFAQGLRADLAKESHFLIRLRVWHPVIAILVSGVLWGTAQVAVRKFSKDKTLERISWILRAVLLIQVAAGGINVLLMAPTWMQVLHLFLADSLLITLVIFSVRLLANEETN